MGDPCNDPDDKSDRTTNSALLSLLSNCEKLSVGAARLVAAVLPRRPLDFRACMTRTTTCTLSKQDSLYKLVATPIFAPVSYHHLNDTSCLPLCWSTYSAQPLRSRVRKRENTTTPVKGDPHLEHQHSTPHTPRQPEDIFLPPNRLSPHMVQGATPRRSRESTAVVPLALSHTAVLCYALAVATGRPGSLSTPSDTMGRNSPTWVLI